MGSAYFQQARSKMEQVKDNPEARALLFERVVDDVDLCLALPGFPSTLRFALHAAIYRARYTGEAEALRRVEQLWGIAAAVQGIAEDPEAHLEQIRARAREERMRRVRAAVGRDLSRLDDWVENATQEGELARLEREAREEVEALSALLDAQEAADRVEMKRRALETQRRKREEYRARAKLHSPTGLQAAQEADRDRLRAWGHQVSEWVFASGSTLEAFAKSIDLYKSAVSKWRRGSCWPTEEDQQAVYELTSILPVGERLVKSRGTAVRGRGKKKESA